MEWGTLITQNKKSFFQRSLNFVNLASCISNKPSCIYLKMYAIVSHYLIDKKYNSSFMDRYFFYPVHNAVKEHFFLLRVYKNFWLITMIMRNV